MSTTGTELERLVVRLVGDASDYTAVLQGAEGKTLDAVKRIAASAEKAMEAQAQALQEAAAITNAVATPTERYAAEAEHLMSLLAAGALDQETYNRAMAVSARQLPSVIAFEQQASEAQARYNAQINEAARVTAAAATPHERFGNEVAKLDTLLSQGHITLETYERATANAAQQLPEVVASQKAAAEAQAVLNAKLQEAAAVTNAALTPEERYATEQQRLTAMLKEGHITQETYNRTLEKAAAQLPTNIAAEKAVTDAITRHNAATQRAGQIMEGLLTPEEKHRKQLAEVNALYAAGYLPLEAYTRATDKLNKELAETQTGLADMGKRLGDIGAGLTNAGQQLSTYVTAPVLAMGAASLYAFGQFDDAMVKSTSIMGAVAPELRKQMEEVAKGVAGDSATGAAKVAEGYYFLASAGLDAAASMKALPAVERFATAGAFDLAKATELLTGAQNALGLRSTDATANLKGMVRVSDVLTEAANKAGASQEEFAKALGNKSGASLRSLNKSMEEGVAVLAVYADQNIKAEQGGEKLAILLRELQNAAQDNSSEWKRMGLSVFDNTGKMRNIGDIIGQLEGKLGGMSDEQKNATFKMLGFRMESKGAIESLLGFSGKIKEYQKALEEAGGATQKVADSQMKSFSMQMKNLANIAEILAIELGELLAPSINWISQRIREGMAWWKGLSKETKMFAIYVAGAAAAVGPLLVALGSLLAAVGAVAGGVAALGGVAAILTAGAWIAGIVAAVAAVGALVYAIVGPEGLQQAWEAVIGWMRSVLGAVFGREINNLTDIWYGGQTRLIQAWGELERAWINTVAFIAQAWEDSDIRLVWEDLVTSMGTILTAIQDAWAASTAWVQQAWSDTTTYLGTKWAEFASYFSGLTETFQSVFGIMTGWFGDAFGDEMGSLRGLWTDFLGFFTGGWRNAQHQIAKGVLWATSESSKAYEESLAVLEDNYKREAALAKATADANRAEREKTRTAALAASQAKQQAAIQELENAEWVAKEKANIEAYYNDAQRTGLGDEMNTGPIAAVTSATSALTDEVEALTSKLKEQIQTTGMNSEEIDIWKLKQKGATEAMLVGARAAVAQIKAKEENKKADEKAKAIMDKIKGPHEKFANAQAMLHDLLNANKISLEAFNLEMAEARKELTKDLKIDFKITGIDAVEAGTAEAAARLEQYRALAPQAVKLGQNAHGKNNMDRAAVVHGVDDDGKMQGLLKDIKDNTKRDRNEVVTLLPAEIA